MTLIAAFRCSEGAVLCADTLETDAGVRVPVHKLHPRESEHYWLAVAGSGHADLIDGFEESLRLDVERWRPGLAENTIRLNIRNLLIDFHEYDLKLYPCNESEKLNDFIVCVKPKQSIDIFMWELRGTIVLPVADYSLLGFGAAMYKFELRKLYEVHNPIQEQTSERKRFGKQKALLLGIHLFSLAKDTSTYIGGDTEAIFVDERAIWPVAVDFVRELERRVAQFNVALANLILELPDTSTHDLEIRSLLESFTDRVLNLRRYHMVGSVITEATRMLEDPNPSLFPMYPPAAVRMSQWDTCHECGGQTLSAAGNDISVRCSECDWLAVKLQNVFVVFETEEEQRRAKPLLDAIEKKFPASKSSKSGKKKQAAKPKKYMKRA